MRNGCISCSTFRLVSIISILLLGTLISIAGEGDVSITAILDIVVSIDSGSDISDNDTEIRVGWFLQKLDHFNPKEKSVWKQQYYSYKKYNREGGPVFLVVWGESAVTKAVFKNAAWIDYAKQLGAIIFVLEHRFFGQSRPTEDVSLQNLKFLCSRQAIWDLASFTTGMKRKFGLGSNRWVAFGQSYAGSLAVWYRLKFPDLVFATVASSAPLEATLDFKEYFKIIRQSLKDEGSPDCPIEIGKAISEVSKILDRKNAAEIKILAKQFRRCSRTVGKSENEVYDFYSAPAVGIAAVVQFNEIPNGMGLHGLRNVNIPDLCKLMTEGKGSARDKYAALNSLLLDKVYKGGCWQDRSLTLVPFAQDSWTSSGVRQFYYQECFELGFFQTSSLWDLDSFGDFPIQYYMGLCKGIFGEAFSEANLRKGIRSTILYYGGKSLTVSRVIFSHGSLDGWQALGITSTKDLNPAASDNLVLYIKGGSHGSDFRAEHIKDSKSVRAARRKTLKQLRIWLSEGTISGSGSASVDLVASKPRR